MALAKVTLRKQGVTIKTIREKRKNILEGLMQKKVTTLDITVFTRQLATMMKAGVPLVQGFEIVAEGLENPAMREVVLGESSIEVWRATGNGDAPFQRIDGRAFNFGIADGSSVRMKDTSIVCVADDGTVFNIAGVPTKISNPSIAERTRDAILAAKEAGV